MDIFVKCYKGLQYIGTGKKEWGVDRGGLTTEYALCCVLVR